MYRSDCLFLLASLITPLFAAGPQTDSPGVHLIAVENEAQAVRLRARLEEGESFYELAREYSTDPSGAEGGYLGTVRPGELRSEFGNALAGLEAGEVSSPVRVGERYYLLGFLSPEEQRWVDENSAGIRAVNAGNVGEAERAFTAALDQAKRFTTGDSRLEQSLRNLADLYYVRQDFGVAAPYYQRLLAVLDAAAAGSPPNTRAQILNRLGEIDRSRKDYASAETEYTRALSLLEESGEPEGLPVASILGNLALLRQVAGDDAGAEAFLERALAILEQNPAPEAVAALARGLANLAAIQERQDKHDDAEAAARRGLAILENLLEPGDPSLTDPLNTLALILESRGEYREAEALYRRAFAIDWRPATPSEPGVLDVLDLLTRALELTSFRDDAFRHALDAFQSAVGASSFGDRLADSVADLLVARGLDAEAEAVLAGAARAFPNRAVFHTKLAELYIGQQRMGEALEELDRARRIPPPPGADPAADRRQRSYFDRRTADIQLALGSLDEALAGYGSAIELDPGNYTAHLGLGNLHALNDGFDEAVASYERAIRIEPERLDARLPLAETNLNMGRFPQASEAADRALEIDPENVEARFMKMRALQLMGRAEEARQLLADYETRAAEQRASDERSADAQLQDAAAAQMLAAGRYDEAADLYRSAVDAHPRISELHLELGEVLSRLGRHREAVGAFEKMIELEIDGFLVHRYLAREYALLDDTESSQRHETIYLGKLYAALKGSN